MGQTWSNWVSGGYDTSYAYGVPDEMRMLPSSAPMALIFGQRTWGEAEGTKAMTSQLTRWSNVVVTGWTLQPVGHQEDTIQVTVKIG